jgi:histidine ammonia-lyase
LDSSVLIGTGGATLDDVTKVRAGAAVALGDGARKVIRASRTRVEEHLRDSRPIYGINTGFGRLASTVVGAGDLSGLQRNLLLSHACGTGPVLPAGVARVVVFLRVASLAVGRSGIREETVDRLLAFLEAGLVPAIPSKGSLGASGDLAPLAHMCLPLLGEGWCLRNGVPVSGADALAIMGLQPLELQAKEGLALINGTPVMTAIASCALLDAVRLADAADVAAACTLEALLGTSAAFHEGLVALRPHPGALETARNLVRLTRDSEILRSHRDCPKVQDAYSLRCVPQVHGASRDAIRYVRGVVETELRSVTDNPLMLEDGSFISGGNFHGQPVALAADHLGLAAAELGSISERRIERLLNPDLSGLPAFLSGDPGLNSGLMIAQYTAASLVSENKVLVHPASADSIPVSAAQEDHVSMATTASRQAAEIVANVERVIATELLCASQAHRFVDRGKPGGGTAEALAAVRSVSSPVDRDRQFVEDLDRIEGLIRDGVFSRILESG